MIVLRVSPKRPHLDHRSSLGLPLIFLPVAQRALFSFLDKIPVFFLYVVILYENFKKAKVIYSMTQARLNPVLCFLFFFSLYFLILNMLLGFFFDDISLLLLNGKIILNILLKMSLKKNIF